MLTWGLGADGIAPSPTSEEHRRRSMSSSTCSAKPSEAATRRAASTSHACTCLRHECVTVQGRPSRRASAAAVAESSPPREATRLALPHSFTPVHHSPTAVSLDASRLRARSIVRLNLEPDGKVRFEPPGQLHRRQHTVDRRRSFRGARAFGEVVARAHVGTEIRAVCDNELDLVVRRQAVQEPAVVRYAPRCRAFRVDDGDDRIGTSSSRYVPPPFREALRGLTRAAPSGDRRPSATAARRRHKPAAVCADRVEDGLNRHLRPAGEGVGRVTPDAGRRPRGARSAPPPDIGQTRLDGHVNLVNRQHESCERATRANRANGAGA